MAVIPSYVGYSTLDINYPTALTITTSDLPAGTSLGDQITVFIRINSHSGFNLTDPSGWPHHTAISTDQSGSYHYLWSYTNVYESGTFPVTFSYAVAPIYAQCQIVIVASSPSYGFESAASGGSPRNSNPVPTWTSGGGLPDLSRRGAMIVLVSVHAFNSGNMDTLTTPNGFTEVADIVDWPTLGSIEGNAKIAWYDSTSPVTNKTLPQWNKTVGFGGAGVVAGVIALGIPPTLPPRWLTRKRRSAFIHVPSNKRRWS